MAYSRLLLLLLIGATVTPLPQVHAGRQDFWCNDTIRLKMRENFNKIVTNITQSNCSDFLASPVPVPCVGLKAMSWKKKTIQEKQTEVLENLLVFQDAIQQVKNQSSWEWDEWVNVFKKDISQNVALVREAYKQNGGSLPTQAPVPTCGEKSKLSDLLEKYSDLVRGKLEMLAVDTGCNLRRKRSLRQFYLKGLS